MGGGRSMRVRYDHGFAGVPGEGTAAGPGPASFAARRGRYALSDGAPGGLNTGMEDRPLRIADGRRTPGTSEKADSRGPRFS